MKLTADTITDEQIRDWECDMLHSKLHSAREKSRAVQIATIALGEIPEFRVALDHVGAHPGVYLSKLRRRRKVARARIAKILDAQVSS